MDKDTSLLDDSKTFSEEDYIYQDDEDQLTEENLTVRYSDAKAGDRFLKMRKTLLSPLAFGKSSLARIFRRSHSATEIAADTVENELSTLPAEQPEMAMPAEAVPDDRQMTETVTADSAVEDAPETNQPVFTGILASPAFPVTETTQATFATSLSDPIVTETIQAGVLPVSPMMMEPVEDNSQAAISEPAATPVVTETEQVSAQTAAETAAAPAPADSSGNAKPVLPEGSAQHASRRTLNRKASRIVKKNTTALAAACTALVTAGAAAVGKQARAINQQLHKPVVLRKPKHGYRTPLLRMLGVTSYLDALKRENLRLRELQQGTDSHIETLKREISYWEHQYQSMEQPGPLKCEIEFQKSLASLHTQSLKMLAQMQTDLFVTNTGTSTRDWPLISIIMPVWNRADMIGEAIESVIAQTYPYWELIIIDDGSTDKTKRIVKPYLRDQRIRYHHQKRAGVSNARNQGLKKSQGSIIAYLDSDNTWNPYVLTMAANYFQQNSNCQSVFFAAVWRDASDRKWLYFPEQFNYAEAIQDNRRHEIMGIDINSFIHRRGLYEELGGFDESLTRLTDYELTYRYQKHSPVMHLPFIGTQYRYCIADNAIAKTENCWHNFYLIRAKHAQKRSSDPGLRILYLLNAYPELSECYLQAEIDYMRRQGVQIEVWSESEPQTPYPVDGVRIHTGSLLAAIEDCQPDIVHAHSLTSLRHADKVAQFGLPMTIRARGKEYSASLLRQAHDHPAVEAVYVFPHFHKQAGDRLEKLVSVPAGFNPERYFPRKDKNRKLVLRVAAASPDNNLEVFIRVARQCPDHRFILAVTNDPAHPEYVDELVRYNKKQGNHVDLRFNVMPEVISFLVQEAGIYLHTHCVKGEKGWTPYGMPVSVCEAMATGAIIIARDCAPAKQYIGKPGQFYETEKEAAVLIHATSAWTDDEWHQHQEKFINRAWQYFVDDHALGRVYQSWQKIKFVEEHPEATTSEVVLA